MEGALERALANPESFRNLKVLKWMPNRQSAAAPGT